jgi:hypothetical protein
MSGKNLRRVVGAPKDAARIAPLRENAPEPLGRVRVRLEKRGARHSGQDTLVFLSPALYDLSPRTVPQFRSRGLLAAAPDRFDTPWGRPTSGTGRGVEGSAVMCQCVVAAVGCWWFRAEPAYPLKLAPVSATHWLSGSRQ